MKIITKDNATDFCVDNLRKIASVFSPVRETVDYKGAEYEVRVNTLSDKDYEDCEILNINIINPQIFYHMYLTALSNIQSVIEEKISEVSEHFGNPEKIEVDVMGLRLIISTPIDDIKSARIMVAHVTNLKEVLENMHPVDFFNIKKEAIKKAKQYFEEQKKIWG